MSSSRKPPQSRGAQEKETPSVSLDYDHIARLCLKHWKLLVTGLVIGVVGGFISAEVQTPIYAARSTIVVQTKGTQVQGVADVSGNDISNMDLLKTVEQLLQTKDLAERVVKSLHLNEDSEFLPAGVSAPVSEDTAASMLAGGVSIHIRPLTRLIDITVEHPSPHMAKVLADAVAQESIAQQFDQSSASATVLSDDLQKEVTQLQQKVAESEQALHDYQVSHKDSQGASLDQGVDMVDSQVKDLNQQYLNAQAQVMLLKERYGENHPRLIQAEATMQELQAELRKAQDGAVALGGQSIGYNTLKDAAESYKVQLNNLQTALNQTQVAQRVTNPGVSVAQLAELPLAPVRPSKTKAVAMGGMAGLVAGLGFIMALYFLDGSLRTVSQAENALNVPVIAAVPILTETDGKTTLPTYSDPQSFVAEAFRGLRASLILQDRESPLRTVLVCSAIPGEGKSFCTANLAVAFAQTGLRTLLIDADLRLPTIHTYFNVPAKGQNGGLTNALLGKETLDDAVLTSAIPTLDLLLTVTPADSPAELLSGMRLTEILDEAATKYDRVVIDSAPLNAVSDTMLIMPKADAILLVVRASQTPASESKAALQKISSGRMKPLGLILNHLAAHTLKSYAYGYSYGQKPKEKNAK